MICTKLRTSLFTVVATLSLAACDTVPFEDTPTRAQIADSTLPPMKAFPQAHPSAPTRSNGNIAADFLDLHFKLESGRELPLFTRFEGPITIRVTGDPPPSLNNDLSKLLARLRSEAQINISQVSSGEANITIQAVSRREIRKALPQAACFVVPNVSSLKEFRRDRHKAKTNWGLLTERSRLGVFIPNDGSPQEIRDCLHEELAQALGPLNDLYRLSDSVFNDDDTHAVLTGFDMLILRATYAPELRSGMPKGTVAARLPQILARMNPQGINVPTVPVSPTPRGWVENVQVALGPGTEPEDRRRAANAAANTAQSLGWTDHRRAFSHSMLGRMTQGYDSDLAIRHYQTAMYYLERTPGTRVHQAHIATRLAAYEISRGNGDAALQRLRPHLSVAAQAENAVLLSTLMLLQAEALDLVNRPDEARVVRLDSLGWARYGFGSDWAVRAKMQEIAALNPKHKTGG
ncbi:MAG: DUF2927 domain-containing protein [Rhodobacteraceae bacterium]|nr:DUF2927 domain-containing protein [Paracoccaceae bacterium]